MRRHSTLSRIGAAVAALWLCIPQPAKAGDGPDLAGLQTSINEVCSAFANSFNPPLQFTCPQLPTISQAVLQLAAFLDVTPEAVRANPLSAIPVGPYVDAGNPSHPPGLQCLPEVGCIDPLNPISTFPIDPGVLSSLRPLAFKQASSTTGSATPTQLYDPSANVFFYAVGGASTNGSVPDTLVLFYNNANRTTPFSAGDVAAKISLPLTVLNKDGVTERSVPIVLQYVVPKTGAAPCSASTVTGNFSGGGIQTLSASQIGVNCALVPGLPPMILEVSVPMLIAQGTDPLITKSSVNFGYYSPFTRDLGFKIGSGKIGISPNAAPLGPGTPTGGTATFALCASLASNSSGLVPAVAAFYAIGHDSEVFVSAPLPSSTANISYACQAT